MSQEPNRIHTLAGFSIGIAANRSCLSQQLLGRVGCLPMLCGQAVQECAQLSAAPPHAISQAVEPGYLPAYPSLTGYHWQSSQDCCDLAGLLPCSDECSQLLHE